ncbi:MAG: nucleotide exchange factor GrpE [Chloroflexi bacterium RBG_13_56_8]|nr:MAG: nucleotide exchange factor GrpE [Chloroflexi bacterium RBG_13_56_8]
MDKKEMRVGSEGAPEEELSEGELLRNEVEEWQAKADEYLDNYRRSVAEFSNYRKREQREREQRFLELSADVLGRFLPILDDFERAIESMPQEEVDSKWAEGLILIRRKLGTLLEDFGVRPIEALGKPFDPMFHSALMQAASDEYPAGTVTEELQRGYLIGDRVLRPVTVAVSTGPDSQDGQET